MADAEMVDRALDMDIDRTHADAAGGGGLFGAAPAAVGRRGGGRAAGAG